MILTYGSTRLRYLYLLTYLLSLQSHFLFCHCYRSRLNDLKSLLSDDMFNKVSQWFQEWRLGYSHLEDSPSSSIASHQETPIHLSETEIAQADDYFLDIADRVAYEYSTKQGSQVYDKLSEVYAPNRNIFATAKHFPSSQDLQSERRRQITQLEDLIAWSRGSFPADTPSVLVKIEQLPVRGISDYKAEFRGWHVQNSITWDEMAAACRRNPWLEKDALAILRKAHDDKAAGLLRWRPLEEEFLMLKYRYPEAFENPDARLPGGSAQKDNNGDSIC